MPYNNDAYSKVKDALVDNLYNNTNWDEINLPPPPDVFLLDNTGDELLDNSGDELLVAD